MTVAERVRAVLADAPVVDGHNDLVWALRHRVGYDFDKLDIAVDQSAAGLRTDVPRLRAGGVGAQFWSVYVPCALSDDAAVVATLEQIDAVYRMIECYSDDLVLARTAGDIERARAAGKIASLLGMEGGHSIACSLGTLRMMYALGVRYLTLTHLKNTPWADSATDRPGVGGLSAFGREVVAECNRLGMLVDLSHVAVSTMHAALDVLRAPAFFSHSSARAVCDHPRNVGDDVLARVRDSEGIVMVTFSAGFLTENCREWLEGLFAARERLAREAGDHSPGWYRGQAEWVQANPRPPCGVGDVADHIEHIRHVAGVDHLGLGGDFDGVAALPDGLQGVEGYPALLAELASRGWTDGELAKLTWHNALRVLRASESVAAQQQRMRGPSPASFTELDHPAAS